jgi:cation:H+ antiporter
MSFLPLIFLLPIFVGAGIVIWIAGVSLTKTTDSLDTRFGLGQAFGGLILLGLTGTLPEIAITFSAAINGHIDVIIGNLIGGIAMQTLVLVILDFAGKGKRPLSYLAGTPILAIEGIFVIIMTGLSLLGSKIPVSYNILHTNPLSLPIFLALLIGLYLINKWRKISKLNIASAPDAAPGRKHEEKRAVENHPTYAKRSTAFVFLIFGGAAVATLVAGVLLEESGSAIAAKIGMSSGIFAATIMALISSLPEISSGLESIFIGDNQLAVSDIFGGNIFAPALFIFADLIAKKPVLSYAGKSDVLFAIVGIALTAIYVFAFFKKFLNRYLRLGFDSIMVILAYATGILVLVFIK